VIRNCIGLGIINVHNMRLLVFLCCSSDQTNYCQDVPCTPAHTQSCATYCFEVSSFGENPSGISSICCFLHKSFRVHIFLVSLNLAFEAILQYFDQVIELLHYQICVLVLNKVLVDIVDE
jgi:hypothetical protein